MSGGSYDYMCLKEDYELFDYTYRKNLEKMIDKLMELGYEDAAREAEELLLTIKQSQAQVETMHDRLRDIFKAVEWCESGDSGPEEIERKVEEYRNQKSSTPVQEMTCKIDVDTSGAREGLSNLTDDIKSIIEDIEVVNDLLPEDSFPPVTIKLEPRFTVESEGDRDG